MQDFPPNSEMITNFAEGENRLKKKYIGRELSFRVCSPANMAVSLAIQMCSFFLIELKCGSIGVCWGVLKIKQGKYATVSQKCMSLILKTLKYVRARHWSVSFPNQDISGVVFPMSN